MADCNAWDFGCEVGNFVNDTVTNVADSAAGAFVNSLAQGTINVLAFLNTFWMNVPTPDVASTTIVTIQDNLAWYTYGFAVIGIFLAVGKMLMAGDFKAGAPGAKMLFNLILVTGVYTTGIALLLKAGDAFAPWIIGKATGRTMDLSTLVTLTAFNTIGVGPGLMLALLAFLGALANVAFMLVRGSMVLILATFLPLLAASSASESGNQAWKKANGYLLAFLLFKPVAAVIIALGLTQVSPTLDSADPIGNALGSVTIGMVTLIMVALALPALIKFIVPVASNGTSMGFSGGAVAAGAVAAGAAVVTLGGGAAAASGAGAAAGKTSIPAATASTGAGSSGGAATGGTSASTGVQGSSSRGGQQRPPSSGDGSPSTGGQQSSPAGGGQAGAPGSRSSARGGGSGTAVLDSVSRSVSAANGSAADAAEEK